MRRLRDESGQVVAFTAILLPLILVLLGLVIDYGGSVVLKRKAQAAADASALAAVWAIPNGAGAVGAAAVSMAAQNADSRFASAPDVSSASTLVPGDSVRVKVSGAWSTVFAKVFGVERVDVSATATAMLQSVVGCSGRGCDVLPWGVPDCAVVAVGGALDCGRPLAAVMGQRVTIKAGSGVGGNFYGLELPQLDGGACVSPRGAAAYSDSIVGGWSAGGALTCNLRTTAGARSGYSTAGCDNAGTPTAPTCVVSVKTGNMVGPTAKGLVSRLSCSSASSCNSDSLAWITGGCDPSRAFAAFCPVLHDSPRLVVVPIVRNLDNSAGYESCASGAGCTVKVVDLVWFYIDSAYDGISGATVSGIFFRSTAPPSFDLLGPYNGGTMVRARLAS